MNGMNWVDGTGRNATGSVAKLVDEWVESTGTLCSGVGSLRSVPPSDVVDGESGAYASTLSFLQQRLEEIIKPGGAMTLQRLRPRRKDACRVWA